MLCGDRLEPKPAFVVGKRAAGQPPECSLNTVRSKRSCLDHGLDDGLPAGAGTRAVPKMVWIVSNGAANEVMQLRLLNALRS